MPETSLFLDILTLAVAVVTVVYFFFIQKQFIGKDDLYANRVWLTAGVFFIFLRKLLDSFGEYFMADAQVINTFEDISFILGLLCLMYSGHLALKFFRSINFRRK
jgi:hypothetical protein